MIWDLHKWIQETYNVKLHPLLLLLHFKKGLLFPWQPDLMDDNRVQYLNLAKVQGGMPGVGPLVSPPRWVQAGPLQQSTVISCGRPCYLVVRCV